jgi:hypothetical protein
MENSLSSENKDLVLTPQSCLFLKETAKWAKFLSIMGFIGVGLMVIMGFSMSAIMSFVMPQSTGMSSEIPTFVFSVVYPIVYLILGGIYIVPIYFLYKFSINMVKALTSSDTLLLTDAFGFLKSHYKYLGIMTIVITSVYALCIVGAVIVVIALAVFNQ